MASVQPVEKWLGREAGRHYASNRFRSRRAAERDPGLVRLILREHGATSILDAPCGTGRLFSVLSSSGVRPVGVDASGTMLAELRRSSNDAVGRCLQSTIEQLPFQDDAFDVVVCCRLLHHLAEGDELARVVAELCRVSSRLVVASFWDAASLPALRRRLIGRSSRCERARTRRPIAKEVMEQVFADQGARVLEYRHSFRFLSQQAFLVATI